LTSGARKEKRGKRRDKDVVKVGDLIRCRDFDDLIRTMNSLFENGVETDFHFPKSNHDFVLEVVKVGESTAGSKSQS
jgi:hypothetical protein